MTKKKRETVIDFNSPDLMYNFYVRQKRWKQMESTRMIQILDKIYPHVNHLQKAEINGIRRKLINRDYSQFGDLEIIA
jgi:hypothetical protein